MKTPKRSFSLAFLFIISFNGLINCEQAVNVKNYELLLDAQFLSLYDEVDISKQNGEKMDTVYRHEVSHDIFISAQCYYRISHICTYSENSWLAL